MERTAKKENRAMSELIRESYRRHVAEDARRKFGRSLEALRAEAANTPAGRITMRRIDAEVAKARRARKRPAAG